MIKSLRMWTEDMPRRCVFVTPEGAVYAERGDVVIVAVISADAGARFVTDLVRGEQRAGIHQDAILTDTGMRFDLTDTKE